jgi:hypothetical protein
LVWPRRAVYAIVTSQLNLDDAAACNLALGNPRGCVWTFER